MNAVNPNPCNTWTDNRGEGKIEMGGDELGNERAGLPKPGP